MKLSVTSWSFPVLTLGEVGGLAKVLGIDAVDVSFFYASGLDRAKVLGSPESYGEEIRQKLPVAIANFYYLFGNGLDERNLALGPDEANLADFQNVLRFTKAAGASSVFILPGLINPGQSRNQAIANSVEALKPLVEAGQKSGVTVTIEPHVHGILESVEAVHDIVSRVPGLRITLDLAHFMALGYRQEEIETLVPHAGHVHLRQARQGALQAKMEQGTINFPSLFGALRDAGYEDWLSIEVVHQAYMDTLYDDVLTEIVKMRDAVRAWSR
ncbi:MAG: xylose isomerase [Pelagibacterium sp. SCN 64-44]|nr:MAG: xylose isomerase [Pelagibacterium sp. SCN 64-44]